MRLGRAKRVASALALAIWPSLVLGQTGGQMTVRVMEDASTVLTRSNTLIELNFGVGFDVSVSGNRASITAAAGSGGIANPGANGIVQCNGTACDNTITVTDSSTVGQVLRVTAAATYGWGALNLADTDAVTGLLPPGNWTPLTTEGDLAFRNGSTTTRLARGSDGQCLVATATTINWATCPGAGGGAPADATYLVTTADGTLSAEVVIGTSSTGGQVLRVTGSNTYGWGALDLADTDAVMGVLPVANWTPLTTEGDIVFRNGSTTTRLARGTNGQCLTSTASTIAWGTCGSGTGITSLGGQTGATQTLTGGTGIDITSSTDDHTFVFDGTEISSLVLGSGSAASITLNASGGTDCVLTGGDGLVQSNCPIEFTGTPGPLVMTEIAAPGAAGSAGQHNLYFRTSDSALCSHENGGAEVCYGAGGGIPTQITVADTTDTTAFCALFESATGDLGPKTDAGCTYNASTGLLTVTGLSTPTIFDTNGNEQLVFTPTGSALNHFSMTNAAVGNMPILAGVGDDTHISIGFSFKGLGSVHFFGNASAQGSFTIYEDTDNGTNNITVAPPASITSNRVFLYPDVPDATVVVAATSTTTTQALFATSTAGAPAYRALATGDLPSGTTLTIASGTKALDTDEIASEACDTLATTTATGTASTDVIHFTPNADITAVTGYAPVTEGGLQIFAWPTTNTINWKVCNPTAAPITPGAVTLNYRVTR